MLSFTLHIVHVQWQFNNFIQFITSFVLYSVSEKITTWGIITLKMLIDICFSYLVLLWSFFSAVNCKFLSHFTVNFNNTEISNNEIRSLSTWNAHLKKWNKSSGCAWLTLIKTKIGLQVCFCGCVFHFVYIMCVCVRVCVCVCVCERGLFETGATPTHCFLLR